MKTETEIRGLTLEELQKFVIDLRRTRTDDRNYGRDKALIDFAVALKKWKEPELVEVKNIADHAITIDGAKVEKDATTKCYPWQLAALRRWLEPAGKAAAALLLGCLVLLGVNATAQVQTTAVGAPGTYHVYYIAGLNGGTNNNLGTNTYATPVTNTTSITTNANWSVVNGTPTNTPSYTTNVTITTPGIISVVNNDLLDVFWGFAMASNSVQTATLTADYSDDLINWNVGAWRQTLVANNTSFVSTNVTLSQFGPGYIRFNTMSVPFVTVGTNWQTNIVLEVTSKASKTGAF
jgi:hypothetical protein